MYREKVFCGTVKAQIEWNVFQVFLILTFFNFYNTIQFFARKKTAELKEVENVLGNIIEMCIWFNLWLKKRTKTLARFLFQFRIYEKFQNFQIIKKLIKTFLDYFGTHIVLPEMKTHDLAHIIKIFFVFLYAFL